MARLDAAWGPTIFRGNIWRSIHIHSPISIPFSESKLGIFHINFFYHIIFHIFCIADVTGLYENGIVETWPVARKREREEEGDNGWRVVSTAWILMACKV